jgi:UDP-glucose:(heptosyl)LPS alpha-1,3-glucosyltransferase
MRIGLISENFDPSGGGAERWTAAFAAYLSQAGHEVHVITFRSISGIAPLILHLLPDPGTLMGRAQAVERAVASLGPMVLHDTGTSWAAHVFHPQTGSRLLSVKQDLRRQGALQRYAAGLSPRTRWRHYLMAQIESRAMANARQVIAVSSRLQTLLAARHHLPLERVRLIPNGIEVANFTIERLSQFRESFRAEYGLGNAFTGVMAAYNLRLKGLETALRGFAILHRQGVDFRLVVAGGMPDPGMLKLVAALGLQEKVLFCGNVAQVAKLYAAADVFVHPTSWDACSLATIEAMAARLPVITTVLDGASDLITDGVDGFVLQNPDDHARLGQCLTALLEEAARRRIGDAACLKANSAGGQDRNFRAVEAVLAEAAHAL